MRRFFIIVGAAAVVMLSLAAVAVGVAGTSAQEGDGPLTTFLARVAEKLGISEDELKGAIQDTQLEIIDEKVADGTLTPEQGEKLKERVEAGEPVFPFGPRPYGPGHRHGARLVVNAAAEVLEMEQSEIAEQLRGGQSLAEIAEAQGMSSEQFQAALLEQIQSELDAKVDEGAITREQADRILERLTERIDDIVNHKVEEGEYGPGRFGPGPGRFAPGFAGPELEPEF